MIEELQRHFEQCCVEYIAQVNGPGEWRFGGEVYGIDFDVAEGPVEMVRRSDEKRIKVEVSVTVWEAS